MKTKELRIGDLFYPINRIGEVAIPDEIPFRVLSIGKVVEGIMYNVPTHRAEMITEFKLCDVSPIPLTEEWLLKFGFENIDGWFYKNVTRLFPIRDLYFRGNYPIKVDIKYVHQLQNLYYALTGEELILKE